MKMQSSAISMSLLELTTELGTYILRGFTSAEDRGRSGIAQVGTVARLGDKVAVAIISKCDLATFENVYVNI